MKSLQLSDNSVVKKNDEILREAKSFYQKLYTSTVAPKNDLYDDLFFPEGNTLILNELEQQECGGPLTETECWESLKSMQSNKSRVLMDYQPSFINCSGRNSPLPFECFKICA